MSHETEEEMITRNEEALYPSTPPVLTPVNSNHVQKQRNSYITNFLIGFWNFFSPVIIAGIIMGVLVVISTIVFKVIGDVKKCTKVVCKSDIFLTETHHSIYIDYEDPLAYFIIVWYGFYVWACKSVFSKAFKLFKLRKLNYIVLVGLILSLFPSIYNCYTTAHYVNLRYTKFLATQMYFCLTTWIPMVVLFYLLDKNFYTAQEDKKSEHYKYWIFPTQCKLVLMILALAVLLSHITSNLIDQAFEDLFLSSSTKNTSMWRGILLLVSDILAMITISSQMRSFKWRRIPLLLLLTGAWIGIYEIVKLIAGFD